MEDPPQAQADMDREDTVITTIKVPLPNAMLPQMVCCCAGCFHRVSSLTIDASSVKVRTWPGLLCCCACNRSLPHQAIDTIGYRHTVQRSLVEAVIILKSGEVVSLGLIESSSGEGEAWALRSHHGIFSGESAYVEPTAGALELMAGEKAGSTWWCRCCHAPSGDPPVVDVVVDWSEGSEGLTTLGAADCDSDVELTRPHSAPSHV